jgi:hypothetical protein
VGVLRLVPDWAIIRQEFARIRVTREEGGHPPDDWELLLAEAQKEYAADAGIIGKGYSPRDLEFQICPFRAAIQL